MWNGWTELTEVDWEEAAERADERVHAYTRAPDGTWVLSGKSPQGRSGRSEGDEWTEVDQPLPRNPPPPLGRHPRRRRMGPVRAVMKALADAHGPENVRLVVWFDN
ncbi:hypothetical protein SNE510_11390 [Streptomyces sp. NE5-10]|uniref:hypothetical protein n=1 Tax=Streptomyces sp. NE5-10 TaxID=2759674 RepID=UPI001905025A|nr:hypothetical protein [Streptomyces sp. NE5-10]GHJ91620.1 hypothetical protein SNE510_11390 [Streptomyces sp. NE5-10]